MKLRGQILAFGLSGAILAGIVGGIGLVSTYRLQGDLTSALQSAHALQASQVVDMMHDAIRADVQSALLGGYEKSPERVAKAGQDLKSHIETLQEELAKLKGAPLSEASQQALAAALPAVKSYVATADATLQRVGQGAGSDPATAQAMQAAFSELEEKLAAVSESIGNASDALQERAKRSVDQAAWSIAAALLLSIASITMLSLWIAARLRQPMFAAVTAAESLARGDLTVKIPIEGNEETRQLLQSLTNVRDGLARIVQEVKSNAHQVATASAQMAQGNQDLSSRTEEQASAIEQTSASMAQLGSAVRQNADNAQQANQLVRGASTVAMKGGTVVGQVVQTMQDINQSSQRISDIIGVIDGIAFQTNILALNAAVEAARAGEQGRGFAVVASEVRSLAGRSAAAAKEIKTLIEASVERVEQGSALVGLAGQTMHEVVESVKRASEIVGAISLASTEQSTGVREASQAVTRMDQTTQQNAALVEESAAAADHLAQRAAALVQAVAVFTLQPSEPGTPLPHA